MQKSSPERNRERSSLLEDVSLDNQDLDFATLQSCRAVEEEFIKEFKVLEKHLEDPEFGCGETTIGSELEIALVNKNNFQPSLVNLEICDHSQSKRVQPEIGKFCLEYNGKVIDINKNPFNHLKNDLGLSLYNLNKIAEDNLDTKLIPIGIMPTITTQDLGMDALTPYWRYHSIDKLLRSLRCNRDFDIDIDGPDPLHIRWYNTVLEGVNSSYQVHLRVNPQDFNDYYNAAQLAASFVLAISGNSPLLFGHRLWAETRIAIFEQAVNTHNIHPGSWQEQQRVAFGRGWIKDGAIGLLKEICELYYPIFPMLPKDNKDQIKDTLENSGPDLMHIVQHNGSVWPWNRPIYDSADGGHFRIEMRYLPAGPSVLDMTINTAFMLGLTKAFSKNIKQYISELPFKYAQYNFYQSAQFGIDAKCIWPDNNTKSLNECNVTEILPQMIDLAAEGLSDWGVSELEIYLMKNGLTARLENRQTGSTWQSNVYDKLRTDHKLSDTQALRKMFEIYINNHESDLSVANWSLDI